MKQIIKLDDGKKTGALREFLNHPEASLRDAAVTAYFSSSREDEDFSVVLKYLDSDSGFAKKRTLVRLLRRKNPDLLEVLLTQLARIDDEAVRRMVQREAQRSASPRRSPRRPSGR